MGDTELSKCTPATRGVWIDLICAMHQSGRSGELCGTTDQIARLARCSTAELTLALTELQTTGTADVTLRNNNVTVINRLMKREAKDRQGTALRVQKHRSNAKCNDNETGKKIEDRGKKKEIQKRDDGASAPTRSFKKMTDKEFYDEVAGFKENYPKEMLRAFYEYWKEPSATGIMRFQLEKTWETALRLNTWQRRDKSFPKTEIQLPETAGSKLKIPNP
jgi:hypothetical protein